MQKKNIFLLILITAALIILSNSMDQPVITGFSTVVTIAAIVLIGKDLFSKKVD